MAKENKSKKEIKALEIEIEKIRDENVKYLDIAQRAQADLINYRKKVSGDLGESEERAQRRMLIEIIKILDQINMALSSKVNTKTYKSWINGIDSISKNFKSSLANFDLSEVNLKEGEKFNPNIHEAISRIQTEKYEEGEIVRQVSPGYKHKEYLLRPVLVEIAFNKENKKGN